MHALGMLSPGELQRLSIARVLYRQPVLAVLDEPISAVSPELGSRLFAQLRSHHIALLTFGQQFSMTMRSHHDSILSLAGDGSGRWTMQGIQGPG